MRFEVYARRGKGWQYLGIYEASTCRVAAHNAGYAHSRRYLGVRPEDSLDTLLVHRFMYTPTLTSSSGRP